MIIDREMLETLKDPESVFYLLRTQMDDFKSEIWFVNNSREILTEVSNSSSGFADAGDRAMPMIVSNPKRYKKEM